MPDSKLFLWSIWLGIRLTGGVLVDVGVFVGRVVAVAVGVLADLTTGVASSSMKRVSKSRNSAPDSVSNNSVP